MENNLIQWAIESILSHGIIIINPPEEVQRTPYSDVQRILTSEGAIYLKKMPFALSLEPDIIRFLHEKHCAVPILLDANKKLNCFLTKDAGISLRDYLKSTDQMELLLEAVKQYTAIQKISVNTIDHLIELGVPDWRLNTFPSLYDKLIANEDFLRNDSITNEELDTLRKLSPRLKLMCDQLSHYNIPETLDHCDFHSNNILIDHANKLTIIDWGETAITNPLFSLMTCMNQAQRHHGMKETDRMYLRLQDTGLMWIEGVSKDNLMKAMSMAKKLWPIYSAFGHYRLMMSSNLEELKAYYANRPNRLAGYLREFIKTIDCDGY